MEWPLIIAGAANLVVAYLNYSGARRNGKVAAANAKNSATNLEIARRNKENADALLDSQRSFSAKVTAHWLVMKALGQEGE